MRKILYTLLALAGGAFAQEKKEAVKEMTLASYNIKHGAGMDGQLNLERTIGVLKKIDADIVALQEVDNKCTRSKKVDQAAVIAKALGMKHAYAKAMNFQGGEYGLAVLSKYPILEMKRHEFPSVGEPRVAMEIIVEPVKGQKMSFISLHFDYVSEEIRQPQIKALFKALENTKHPVVLIGDFNATPDSDSIKLFAQEWTNIPKKGDNLTAPASKPRNEIDYFMTRGIDASKLTCTVIEEKVASDHRPLMMKLPLPEVKK